MIDRELEALRQEVEATPGDPARWPDLLTAYGRAGRLEEGLELLRGCLARAGGGERLERALLGEGFRAGFGLGDPFLQVKSGLAQVEFAPDGRHLLLVTGRTGARLLETAHFTPRVRIEATEAFHLVEFAADGRALCLGLVESRAPDPGKRIRLVFWRDGEPPAMTSFTCALPGGMEFRLLAASEDWRHFLVAGISDQVGFLELADWRDPGSALAVLGFHRIGPYLPHDRISPESLPPHLRLVMPDGWLEARGPRPRLPGAVDPGRAIWTPGETHLWIEAGGRVRAAPAVHAEPIVRVAFGDGGRQLLSVDRTGTGVLWSFEEGLPFLKLEAGPDGPARLLDLAARAPLALVGRGIRWEAIDTRTRQVRAAGAAHAPDADPWAAAALSADGSAIVYGTRGGRLGIHQVFGPGGRDREGVHPGGVAACGWLAGGRGVWSLGAADRVLAVHEPGALEPAWRRETTRAPEPGPLPAVLALPDRDELFVGIDGMPALVGRESPKPRPLFMKKVAGAAFAISPDGRELAAARREAGFTLAELPAPGSPRKAWEHTGVLDDVGPVRALAYSPDGRVLVYAQSCHLRLCPRGA